MQWCVRTGIAVVIAKHARFLGMSRGPKAPNNPIWRASASIFWPAPVPEQRSAITRHTERDDRGRRAGPLDFPAVASGAAFFDLDKTVVAKSSALAFGRPFYREHLINRRDVIKSAYAQLMFKLGGADDAQIARIRDHLATLCKGWSVEQVQQIVNETLSELISPYIYAEAAALIDEHQRAGRDVVLVSASGEEMVRPIGDQLGIRDIIATRMVVKDGRYSGDVEFYNAGPNKLDAVREMAAKRGWDLADSYAYSDSVSDVPLLEAVGRPTAVNADRGLRRIAIERGWPMLEFRHPIPLGQRLRDRPAVPVAAAALGVSVGVAVCVVLYGRHRRRITESLPTA
jgi:HAD superfamily hydrolase (TIGR01490 family)